MKCNVCGRSLELWRLESNRLTTKPHSSTDGEIFAALTRTRRGRFACYAQRARGSEFRRVCDVCANAAFDVFHETRNRITADAFAEFCNRTENE